MHKATNLNLYISLVEDTGGLMAPSTMNGINRVQILASALGKSMNLVHPFRYG